MTSPLLIALARKYVWWQSPEETLDRLDHFLCQLMTLATADDVRAAPSRTQLATCV